MGAHGAPTNFLAGAEGIAARPRQNPDLRRRNFLDLLAPFRQLAHCKEPSTCHGRRALSDACPNLTLPAVDIRNLVRSWATVMRPPATSTVVTCFIVMFGERDIIAVI